MSLLASGGCHIQCTLNPDARTQKQRAYGQGGEHGILGGVCSLVVAQLVGAPKLVLLLRRPVLDMRLGVVGGDPQDHEAAVANGGAGQAAVPGVKKKYAAGAAALSAG